MCGRAIEKNTASNKGLGVHVHLNVGQCWTIKAHVLNVSSFEVTLWVSESLKLVSIFVSLLLAALYQFVLICFLYLDMVNFL